MRRSRFTEAQTVAILQELDATQTTRMTLDTHG
jgi:hypothetical protein